MPMRPHRHVARAQRHLDPGEPVLASAVGRELAGRRGRVVLVTNTRVVVAWTRAAPSEELSLLDCTATYDSGMRILTLDDGATLLSIGDVDPHAARSVVECLAHHDRPPVVERIGPPFHVRLVHSDRRH